MLFTYHSVLTQLNHCYHTPTAQLFLLYGRRRVGKTELIRAFVADKPHIFFIATLSSDADQLAAFSQLIWKHLHGEERAEFSFPSWEVAFAALATLPNRPIIIINEITYLLDGNRDLLTTLQQMWDAKLCHANLFLLLCGSYVGKIERELFEANSPLFGRYTGSTHLQPLDLPAAARFFPNYTPSQQLEAWAILGGMPYYLQVFDDQVSVFDNIQKHVLHRRGTLYSEPQLLLLEELHDPRNYFSILRAIAGNKAKLSEISQSAGFGNSQTTGKYIDVLRQLGLVERQVSVTEREPEKSRKGLYRIEDAFLRFWFRFVHPNLRALSLDLDEDILTQQVKPHFNSFVGYAFEQAAQDYIAAKAHVGKLSFTPHRIGRWWNDQEEIAVVALNEQTQSIFVGDCSWEDRPVTLADLNALRHKTALLNHNGDWQQITYALFAKSGFSPEVKTVAAVEGILLVSAEELVKDGEVMR
ncbi:MAG: ATP-binding protein [Caldilineaceae bacterium]